MLTLIFILTSLAAAVTETALHYIPWHTFPAYKVEMPRTHAYVYGVIGILFPPTVVGLLQLLQPLELVALYWTAAMAGGVTVWGLYAFDNYANMKRELDITKRENKVLRDDPQK